GGIAEPEGQSCDKTYLRHFDRIESITRIDPVTHGATSEYGRTDIVPDRITGEAGERCNTIGNFVGANGPQSEQVKERQREIAASHEKSGRRYVLRLCRLQRSNTFIGVVVGKYFEEHNSRHADDGHAQQHADPIPADR